MRNQIIQLIKTMPINEAIALIESIGKELRRKNSMRINGGNRELIEFDRPDLENMKS